MFLPANIHSAFPALEHLEVSESRLMLVDDQTFHGLGEIKSLNLTGNKLTTIGSGSFADLNELETLDLSSNRIESIRFDAFVGLGKRKVLDLNSNKLGKIASTFLSPMPLLGSLDLGNNSCIDLRHPQVSLEAIKAATIANCVKPIELQCNFGSDHGECLAENLRVDQPNLRISTRVNGPVNDRGFDKVTSLFNHEPNRHFLASKDRRCFPESRGARRCPIQAEFNRRIRLLGPRRAETDRGSRQQHRVD
jgi:Leucine rich repeat